MFLLSQAPYTSKAINHLHLAKRVIFTDVIILLFFLSEYFCYDYVSNSSPPAVVLPCYP